jgi:peptidyl-prolyl cis-trans isomerase SurA
MLLNRTYRFLLFLLVLVIPALGLFAQQPQEGEEIDKIVAVVGNDIIMLSELNAQILMFAQQDQTLNPQDPMVKTRVLEMLINEKLVTMKAIEDSIEVSDDEIKAKWQEQLNDYVKYYGSVKRIEDIYGMSIDRMQYEFREEIRKHLLNQKIKAKKFSEVKVTHKETEEFYAMFKDTLPNVPAQVELFHIVKLIQPKKATKEAIYKLAISIRDSLLKGGSFSDFASRYSGDPGTVNSGGDIGWIGKGKLFIEFEQTALALQTGDISLPTETPFGYHLIELLGKNRDSIHTRHILFKFSQSSEDKDETIAFLNKLRETAIRKDTSFEDLARRYSEENETKGFGGLVGKFPLNNLPPSMQEMINKLDVGGISEPIPYGQEPKASYHILYKKSIIPEHKASLEQDYKQIEMMAINYKQGNLYQAWIETLRKTMYWEIK